ncbi:MAG: hypothetical protein JSS66_02220 [Armatimonadetes bacterium]|nr:hypothetical protein [Armatimonadota bacterium]
MGQKPSLIAWAAIVLCSSAQGSMLLDRPHDGTGGLINSAWVSPDGSDADMYAYDSFVLPTDANITEVHWRGGYIYGALYGKVTDFSVYFYATNQTGFEPYCGNPSIDETIYLKRYFVGNNAGETPAGSFGGTPMYDYQFTFPTPFQATAGVKYWIRIEGYQSAVPDWGIAKGLGGDGNHFHFSTGAARFYFAPGDPSFTLYGTPSQYQLAPTSFTVNLGRVDRGNLASLAQQDGDALRVCRFIVPNQQFAPVAVQLDTTCPVNSASSISFRAVSRMQQPGLFSQTLDCWNWSTNNWDGVDLRTDPVDTTTTTRELVGTGDLSRLLRSDGALRARYRVRQTGPASAFAWCHEMDQAVWTIVP